MGKGMGSLRDHIVFVRLLQPEVDHNSQHARYGDIVDHAYTSAHRTPPVEYEAQEDTFLLLPGVLQKQHLCHSSPIKPGDSRDAMRPV